MTAASLAAWGVLRPVDVVRIAGEVRLSLAAAATLLEKESGGGRNVWGADPVPGRGTLYRSGAEVTRADYLRYRTEVRAGRAGRQGVGPTQLTYGGFQDRADELGGCWDPLVNMRVGFEVLRDLQRSHGVRGGFRRYNGSGSAAERYADDAVRKLARWSDRLGQPAPSPTPRPPAAPAPAPAPREDDDDMTPDERAALFEVRDLVRALKPGVRLPGRSAALAETVDDHFGWAMTGAGRADDAAREVAGLRGEVAALRAQLDERAPAPVQIDYAVLARELIAAAKEG